MHRICSASRSCSSLKRPFQKPHLPQRRLAAGRNTGNRSSLHASGQPTSAAVWHFTFRTFDIIRHQVTAPEISDARFVNCWTFGVFHRSFKVESILLIQQMHQPKNKPSQTHLARKEKQEELRQPQALASDARRADAANFIGSSSCVLKNIFAATGRPEIHYWVLICPTDFDRLNNIHPTGANPQALQ